MDWRDIARALGIVASILTVAGAMVSITSYYVDWRADQTDARIDREAARTNERMNRIADVLTTMALGSPMTKEQAKLAIDEVLRKCEANPKMCGEGN